MHVAFYKFLIFEVLTAVKMLIAAFWVVTPYCLEEVVTAVSEEYIASVFTVQKTTISFIICLLKTEELRVCTVFAL
jgi:hypothetical protein